MLLSGLLVWFVLVWVLAVLDLGLGITGFTWFWVFFVFWDLNGFGLLRGFWF